jgi:hypothetical protein
MKQSRATSLTKSVLSTAAGFFISLFAQWLILPMIGVTINLHQNLFFAVIMTVISIARGYVLERIFEFFGMRVRIPASILAIAAERQRQITAEGWTPEHDDDHAPGEMALAASCYAETPSLRRKNRLAGEEQIDIAGSPDNWPWDREWWKPQDNRRDLIRAGALIAAELDLADRKRKTRAVRNTAALPNEGETDASDH